MKLRYPYGINIPFFGIDAFFERLVCFFVGHNFHIHGNSIECKRCLGHEKILSED